MYQSVEALFNAFNRLKVLIVGDVMVDAYVWGKVERISPEAPVPVVQVRQREKRLGGAANVALNVQALGATPLLCAIVGNDYAGDDFVRLLQEQQIDQNYIVRSSTRPTTIKERIIAGSQQMLRIDAEDEALLNASEEEALMAKIHQALPSVDVVVFQDYDKGVLNQTRIRQIIKWAEEHKIPTAVDPKRRNFLHYQHATLFKPNLKELREGLASEALELHKEEHEMSLSIEEAVALASTRLRERLQVNSTLITLSERGIFIDAAYRNQSEQHHLPAHVRQIADVSGAGDTVISIAALALALRIPPRLLAELANLGGGIVCESTGVVPIVKDKLLQEAKRVLDTTLLYKRE